MITGKFTGRARRLLRRRCGRRPFARCRGGQVPGGGQSDRVPRREDPADAQHLHAAEGGGGVHRPAAAAARPAPRPTPWSVPSPHWVKPPTLASTLGHPPLSYHHSRRRWRASTGGSGGMTGGSTGPLVSTPAPLGHTPHPHVPTGSTPTLIPPLKAEVACIDWRRHDRPRGQCPRCTESHTPPSSHHWVTPTLMSPPPTPPAPPPPPPSLALIAPRPSLVFAVSAITVTTPQTNASPDAPVVDEP